MTLMPNQNRGSLASFGEGNINKNIVVTSV